MLAGCSVETRDAVLEGIPWRSGDLAPRRSIPAASCEDARLTSLTQLLVFRGRISAPRSPSTGARAAIAAHACPIGYCATGCIVTGVAGILKVNRRVRTGTGSGKIGALWWFVFIRRCFYGEGVLRDLDQGGSRVMIELVSDVKL